MDEPQRVTVFQQTVELINEHRVSLLLFVTKSFSFVVACLFVCFLLCFDLVLFVSKSFSFVVAFLLVCLFKI